tara:strand:- start:47 stop:538 length:492 start_codon:yes stop_codon:yes gene_type:complete
MKLVSYLLCLLFFTPLLTGCFGNNEIEHDEALVGDWYIADEVVISFYSNGTVIGDEGQQGTWSTAGTFETALNLNWDNYSQPTSIGRHKGLYYSINDGWLIVLLYSEEAIYECEAVSKDSISVDNWNSSIENLEKLSIQPKGGYSCDEGYLYGDLYLLLGRVA